MIHHRADKRFHNSLVKVFKLQLGLPFFPKEVHQQSRLCFFIHVLSQQKVGVYVMLPHSFHYPPHMSLYRYSV